MSVGGDLELAPKLAELARVRSLLVASDFDGTLAPIVDVPSAARPVPGAIAILFALAALERTSVAVISARPRAELAHLGRFPFGRTTYDQDLGPQVVD